LVVTGFGHIGLMHAPCPWIATVSRANIQVVAIEGNIILRADSGSGTCISYITSIGGATDCSAEAETVVGHFIASVVTGLRVGTGIARMLTNPIVAGVYPITEQAIVAGIVIISEDTGRIHAGVIRADIIVVTI